MKNKHTPDSSRIDKHVSDEIKESSEEMNISTSNYQNNLKDYSEDRSKSYKPNEISSINHEEDEELAEFLAIEKSCRESTSTNPSKHSSKVSPREEDKNVNEKRCKDKSRSK